VENQFVPGVTDTQNAWSYSLLRPERIGTPAHAFDDRWLIPANSLFHPSPTAFAEKIGGNFNLKSVEKGWGQIQKTERWRSVF